MLYRIKTYPKDFIVHEDMSMPQRDRGQYFCIYFEKNNRNTMEVLLQICESLGIMKKYVGVAGLKDKVAITRQWISIPIEAVDMVGGKKQVTQSLENQQGVTVLRTTWSDQSIGVGTNQGNTFLLRVRAQKDIDDRTKDILLQRCKDINENGFANYFGVQRFGKGLRNFKRAQRVIDHQEFRPGEYVSKFILSSYQNFYFNRYVAERLKQKEYLLPGDIVVDTLTHRPTQIGYISDTGDVNLVSIDDYKRLLDQEIYHPIENFSTDKSVKFTQKWHITGPLLGTSGLLPKTGSLAYHREFSLYSDLNFWDQKVQVCQHFGIIGRRRPLWVSPSHFEYGFEQDDLVLRFHLPTGSYATVLLASLFEGLDEKTLISNKLVIPK